MKTKEQRNRLTIAAITVVVLVAAVLLFMYRPDEKGDYMAPLSGTESTQEQSTGASAQVLAVADQKAGGAVLVDSADCATACWIAIQDAKGWTLGAAWVPAGMHSNVSVELLRATSAGGNYTAVVYTDNGDKKFDLHADTLVTSASGAPVSDSFSAQ